jgi:ABC-type branched-subunit amino acid transport system substrate-binding protein
MDACFTLDLPRARKPFLRFALLCLSIFLFSQAKASEEIRVGMSAALSGLNADLGISMKNGIELGFAEVNAKGGIQGRKLRLISKDDAYEALRAAKNMHELIESDKVMAILGNTGTPTAVLTVPIANKKSC